jgi:hypothetical protein
MLRSVQLSSYPISKHKVMIMMITLIWSMSSQAVRLLTCFREMSGSDLDRDNDYPEFSFCCFPVFELSVHCRLIQGFPHYTPAGRCGSKSWAEKFRH